jgi:hypothetical protein
VRKGKEAVLTVQTGKRPKPKTLKQWILGSSSPKSSIKNL